MRFHVTPYHSNLIKDKDRLAAFFEGFDESFSKNKNLETAFDIGCGSGVLSFFASQYFNNIIAIDIDSKIIDYAKKSFKEAQIENVNFVCEDASSFDFKESADLIICEMLDTALIDEEEVPVLKNAKRYLKEGGKIIPQGIINIAEPVHMERENIHYEDEECHGIKPNYKVLGKGVKFSELNFLENLEEEFKAKISFSLDSKINLMDNYFNGIKITTFTKITEDIICGPTPMLNPPLFIPVDTPKEKYYKNNNALINKISVELEYIMGGGVESIKTSIL